MSEEVPSLNVLNYLNLVGFIINTFVTFAASPILGFPSNAKLSEKYQTLVTPFGAAFGIWSVIFVMQGVFAVYQMLERYRGDKLVQDGVSFYYFIACMCQCAWTFAFGYEMICLSVIFMLGILVSLIMIVNQQSYLEVNPPSEHPLFEFWILKFPFSVHCGWIAAAFAINMNVLALSLGAGVDAQVALAYATLVFAGFMALYALAYVSPSDLTIPLVILWATIGIIVELNDPVDRIKELFDEDTISTFRGWTWATSIILGLAIIGYGVLLIMKNKSLLNDSYQELSRGE